MTPRFTIQKRSPHQGKSHRRAFALTPCAVKTAFQAEVARWQADTFTTAVSEVEPATKPPLNADGHLATVEINGNIWRFHVEPGKDVATGELLVIVEAMKH